MREGERKERRRERLLREKKKGEKKRAREKERQREQITKRISKPITDHRSQKREERRVPRMRSGTVREKERNRDREWETEKRELRWGFRSGTYPAAHLGFLKKEREKERKITDHREREKGRKGRKREILPYPVTILDVSHDMINLD